MNSGLQLGRLLRNLANEVATREPMLKWLVAAFDFVFLRFPSSRFYIVL
jgi:hypothetical protein